jgi:cob(I)alamin adenosyltransferase
MSIVTKTGDGGETALLGGKRVLKSDMRLHAYGTVDELNAFLGRVLAGEVPESIRSQIMRTQHLLFRLGADLAAPLEAKIETKRIDASHVGEVDQWVAELETRLPQLTHFILPGGSPNASALHVARTVCRRAERWTVALSEFEQVNPQAIIFLNRLGDFLFLAAREMNREAGAAEVIATY